MSATAMNPLVICALLALALIACESDDCPEWTFQGDTSISAGSAVHFAVWVCSDDQTSSVGDLATASGGDGALIDLDGVPRTSFELRPSAETATWHYLALVASDTPSARFTLVDETSQRLLVSAQIRGTAESCPALTVDLGP